MAAANTTPAKKRNGLVWPVLTLAASALVLSALLVLDRSQSREFNDTLWLVRDFRLARIDLAVGLLHLDLSADASPSASAAVRTDVDHSLVRLDRSLERIPGDLQGVIATLRPRIAEFRRRLAAGATNPLQGQGGQPARETLQEMESDLARLDGANAAHLRTIQARQRAQFDWSIAAALALLLAVGIGMLRSGRRLATAETARSESDHRWRQTLELLPQMVWTCAPDGRCEYLSPRWIAFTGVPMEQQLGTDWLAQIHPEDRESVLASWQMAVDTGSDWHGESRVRREDGVYRWIEHRAGKMLDNQGRLTKWLGTSTDITERKEAEVELQRYRQQLEQLVSERTQALQQALQERSAAQDELQQTNAQLLDTETFVRLVADNIPGRVVYWDRELRCRFMNRAFGAWFGHEADQAIGRTAVELRGPDYFERVRPRLQGALDGEAQDFEREEFSASGEFAVTRVQYVPDVRGNEVRGFVVLATNVTRQKQAEQLLRLGNEQLAEARDRADEANRAKSTFLANMSHEIRTPMNAIIGLTHMLRRDIQDPVHRDRLGKIWDSAHHLLQVINDILDLSKIEAGKLVLEDIDFSLDALLSRTCSMVLQAARDKGLELVLDTGHLPDRLHGDPTRLLQALLNLLGNAVKFTQRGSVTVRGELLSEDLQSLLVRFEVRDTGRGVAANILPQLFNPFAQADGSSTRLHGGTGLGLVITRHIAELMGGEAGAESELGKGSRFWFTVRLKPAQAAAQVTAPVLRGTRVLLVDDLPEAREALGEMLRSLGMRTDTAADGEQALGLAEVAQQTGDPYGLVLLDWAMPEMDGFQAATRMRLVLDPPPPLVLVSARDHATLQQEAQATGFAAVLLKPVTPSMLLDCLMRVIKNGNAAAALPTPALEASEELLRQRHAGARVLLAEDNPVNQEVAAELLQAVGLVVDMAGNGEQAVRMVRRSNYELVLMDMQMPNMDGLQATRVLREDPAYARLPIIAMTANAFGEDRQACLDAGMNDHLSKPVDPRVLHAMLLRWLPERPAVAPAAAEPAAVPLTPEQRLEGLQRLDVNVAYQYCMDKPEIVLRVLTLFVSHYRNTSAALLDSLQAGHTEEPRRKLHALRGAAGPIGATRVYEMASQLEASIKAGVRAADLLAPATELCEELDALIAEVAPRLEA